MVMTGPTHITEQWDHRYDTNANAESVEQRQAESVLAIRIEIKRIFNSRWS
jgi:hypothetical protein